MYIAPVEEGALNSSWNFYLSNFGYSVMDSELSELDSVRLDCKTVRIFAYSSTREQSNKRSGTESETGERCVLTEQM